MHKHVTEKYVPVILFTVIFGAVLYLLYSFLVAILGAIVLTVLFAPLYKKIFQKTKKKALSAGFICLIVLLVIFIPLSIIFQIIFVEATELVTDPNFASTVSNLQHNIVSSVNEYSYFDIEFNFVVEKGITYAGSFIQSLITSVPSKILFLFVMFFLFYYLLKDGEQFTTFAFSLFGFSENKQKRIQKRFSDVTYGVVYGQVITAIFQGLIATVGYMLFGVKLPFLAGLLTTFFAFIPMFGTGIVWLPLSIFFISQGNYVQGIGLLAYGALIVGLVDNILRPFLISEKAKLHPALVLIGVVSGLKVFGILGLFIGPLFIAAAKQLLSLYFDEDDGAPVVKKAVKKVAKKTVKKSTSKTKKRSKKVKKK